MSAPRFIPPSAWPSGDRQAQHDARIARARDIAAPETPSPYGAPAMAQTTHAHTIESGRIVTSSKTTRSYSAIRSVTIEAARDGGGFVLTIGDEGGGLLGARINLNREQLLAVADQCRVLAGPDDARLADITDGEIRMMLDDGYLSVMSQIPDAEAALARWGLSPADQERLLRRYFGDVLVTLCRAAADPQDPPASREQTAAPQAPRGPGDE